jgi:hypothetical protein
MLLFHDEMVSGGFDLMSFSHTACGARFTTSWRIRNLLGPSPPEWPFNQFKVRDDRGHRYRLDFRMVGPPESTCDLRLYPEPPRDIRWLDVIAPGEAAVRISLEREAPGTPDGAGPQVRETGLSVAEHLLNQIAERLLATAPRGGRPGGGRGAPRGPVAAQPGARPARRAVRGAARQRARDHRAARP